MSIAAGRRVWMILGCTGALLVSCGGSSSPVASPSPTGNAAYKALPAAIRQAGVLKMASELDYPPYEFVSADGTQTGFEVELAQAMAKDMGINLAITNVNFADLIPSLISDRYDMSMSGMTDTVAREMSVAFVDYLQLAEGILVTAGNPKHVSISNYCGLTIVDPTGSLDLIRAQALAASCTMSGKAPIKIVIVPTTAADILALESGRADASLSSPPANAYSAQQSNGKLVALPGILPGTGGHYAGIGLTKSNTALQQALVIALNDIIASGEYLTILNKYGVASLAITKATVNIATNPSQ